MAKFSFAAKRIKRGVNYKLWKDGFHPVILDNGKKITQRINYIHQNPVESGFVLHERDWKNSSYCVYEETCEQMPNVAVSKLF